MPCIDTSEPEGSPYKDEGTGEGKLDFSVHEKFLVSAIRQAKTALSKNEAPIGAVIAKNNKIIARGYNKVEATQNPTAHAEIIAINKASRKLKNWRLSDTTIYVTKEPCSMCAGAIAKSRVKRLVFGAYDKRFGCAGSAANLLDGKTANHKVEIIGGVLENECKRLLKSFFVNKRNKL